MPEWTADLLCRRNLMLLWKPEEVGRPTEAEEDGCCLAQMSQWRAKWLLFKGHNSRAQMHAVRHHISHHASGLQAGNDTCQEEIDVT